MGLIVKAVLYLCGKLEADLRRQISFILTMKMQAKSTRLNCIMLLIENEKTDKSQLFLIRLFVIDLWIRNSIQISNNLIQIFIHCLF